MTALFVMNDFCINIDNFFKMHIKNPCRQILIGCRQTLIDVGDIGFATHVGLH